ncbi:high affinity choline transporter 1-like, partial [Neolamprologus brichardi]|uniref:high affinity choline transporter 1-like n=1 Tax=Neolamprologus brichardi TaxID=32507 RepID=UPI001643C2DB
VVMALFYLLILGTGIWASLRSKKEEKKCTGDGMEITLLAGRNINLLVGIFTLTATWVGGGFILGIAEATYNPTLGAVWALMPVPYVVTFFLGGFFFAKPMRENKYVTMMDPFQKKYGNVLASALIFPALVADVLWVARTLVSLGGTMSVILDLPYVYSIIISSVVAIVYTLLGGLYSVAYTDVIQLILIFISLWVCVPFMMTNPHSVDISLTAYNATFQAPWVGTVELDEAGKWFDDFMLLLSFPLLRQASDCEMQWVIRISVVVVGLAGTGLTFLDSSVLVFWIVGVDMSYTIMFPQLVCILFFKVSNGYGAIVGYIMGLLMRILSGEPLIGLPPAIQFPGCRLDKEGKLTQYFPFRTAIMLISLMSILLVSLLASIIFNKGLLPEKWDVFNVKRRQRATAKVTRIKRTNSEKEEAAVAKQLLDTTSC